MEPYQNTQVLPIWQAEQKSNYGAKFTAKGTEQGCYTKKQMMSFYPSGEFERVGEFAANSRNKKIGRMNFGTRRLPVFKYGAHSRLLYREKGFVSLGEERYAALLENVVVLRAAALVLCVALIAAAAVFGPSLWNGNVQAADLTAQAPAPDLEEGAVDWEGVQPRDTGGVTAGIAIPGYESITIDANQTDVKVNFQNPEGNPCYFVISLMLSDGTVLYQSKMIEPGKGLYDITLAKALESGEYGAKVKYETYALGDLSPMNGAEVEIVLIAE